MDYIEDVKKLSNEIIDIADYIDSKQEEGKNITPNEHDAMRCYFSKFSMLYDKMLDKAL